MSSLVLGMVTAPRWRPLASPFLSDLREFGLCLDLEEGSLLSPPSPTFIFLLFLLPFSLHLPLLSGIQQISKLLHKEAQNLTPIPQRRRPAQVVFAKHSWTRLLASGFAGELCRAQLGASA